MSATSPRSRLLQFDVQGMSCDGCRQAITRKVVEVEGVASVDVDLDEGTVTISGAELVEQVLHEAILMAGYDSRLRIA